MLYLNDLSIEFTRNFFGLFVLLRFFFFFSFPSPPPPFFLSQAEIFKVFPDLLEGDFEVS